MIHDILAKLESRPRVLILGQPKHTGGEIETNRTLFDIDILPANSRTEAITKISQLVHRQHYDAVICRLGTQAFQPFNSELLGSLMPHLRIVVSAASGYDDFDLDWMTSNDILFYSTQGAMAKPTADMALFLVLAVLRNTSNAERDFRNGLWRDHLDLAPDFRVLTLGIVGAGRTGCALAHKAAVLGFRRILLYSPRAVQGLPPSAQWAESLDKLLVESDVLSLHCPLVKETARLIGARELGLMKKGSYLVNTARGGVVDEEALIAALESGRLKRAGLDVFEREPDGINPYFRQSDKTVVQPHVGGLSGDAFARAEAECFGYLMAYFYNSGGKALTSDNGAKLMTL